jgi:hypothetical protein
MISYRKNSICYGNFKKLMGCKQRRRLERNCKEFRQYYNEVGLKSEVRSANTHQKTRLTSISAKCRLHHSAQTPLKFTLTQNVESVKSGAEAPFLIGTY